MAEEEKQISKYSSGVNIIIRLDNLWKETHSCAKAKRFYLWNIILDRIWLELARDLSEKEYNDSKDDDGKEIKGLKTRFENFDEEILKSGQINDSEPEGFVEPTKEQKDARAKHYKLLMEKQLFLARLENTLGKGTTFDDEDEDDFN